MDCIDGLCVGAGVDMSVVEHAGSCRKGASVSLRHPRVWALCPLWLEYVRYAAAFMCDALSCVLCAVSVTHHALPMLDLYSVSHL